MADPSGSIALPFETASFSRTSSTKSSLRVVVPPPAIKASFSLSSPTKLSPNSTPIIASTPTSTLTDSSPSGTVAPFSSTSNSLSSTPTKGAPAAFFPPIFSNAILSPSTTSSSNATSPTKLSLITPPPPSTSTAPAQLPLSPGLPHSPSTVTSSTSDSTINVSDLQGCIDDVISALKEKGHKGGSVDRDDKKREKSRLVERGSKLKDAVQHVSSDFSKAFGSISEGANIISDQKSCSTMLHGRGHSMASEIIKDVANIQWAAIGLLTIADVLQRFDKISVNDRDCFDLLKVMLDLAKVLKQLKDNGFDLHKEIAEKMVDALWLISSGAKLCRSFIAHKKILKFFFTTKIRDDLKYIRREIDSVRVQLSLQIQIKDASFNKSSRQTYSDGPAVHSMLEPIGLPIEESNTTNETIHAELPSEQPTTTTENVHEGRLSSGESPRTDEIEIIQCEAEDAAAQAKTCAAYLRSEMDTTNPNTVCPVNEGNSDEAVSFKEINKVDRSQKSNKRFFKLPACLKKLKGQRSQTQIKQEPAKKAVVGISLDKRELSSFSIEDGCGGIPTIHFTLEELCNATNGFRHQLKSSHARFNMFQGTLASGKQVTVRTFSRQEASSSEQDSMKIMLNELGCMLRLQHKNVVKLVGFCNIEKDEPMLVYDYPPNGNLFDFLSGESREGNGKGKKKLTVLEWSERLKIIMGVISALIYLHEAADDHMYWVHTDLKPENILLDGNFNAKLSDFSLAKAFSFEDSSSRDGRMSSSEVDIYSFGILLLQVISGRASLPTKNGGDEVDLRVKAWSLYKKECLHELIDPDLLEREGCDFTSIIRSIKVGLWCLVTDPSLRPRTSNLSAMLSTEKEIPPLTDECISMEAHSDECNQCHESDESVRSVEGSHSEVQIEIVEPRA